MIRFNYRLLATGLLVCLMLPACSVSRRQAADCQSVSRDSLSVAIQDSVHYQRLLQASDRMAVRLQHITFSPPDSLGKQYLLQLTVADVQRNQAESLRDTFYAQSASQTQRVFTAQTMEQTVCQSKRAYFPVVFLIASGIAVLGAVLFCRRRTR